MTGVLNKAEALKRVGGDEELLCEIAELFLQEFPGLLADIQAAMAAGDAHALERAAHNLKGSVANFGAEPAREAAYRVECIGRQGDLSSAAAAIAELDDQLGLLQAELVTLTRQG